MAIRETRDLRPLIFLTVLALHIAIVLLVVRMSLQQGFPGQIVETSLILLLLTNTIRTPDDVVTSSQKGAPVHSSPATVRLGKVVSTPDNALTVFPEEPPPKVDWEQEVELAAKDAVKNVDKQTSYRDLSALSPAQLNWVRHNHLEPVQPGMPWKYRRVEMAEGGFPIIHINDHCVAIPLLMMMVFCQIGHIEPKGDLFEHMRDLPNP